MTDFTIADRIADELDAVTIADERTLAIRAAQNARRQAERAARAQGTGIHDATNVNPDLDALERTVAILA